MRPQVALKLALFDTAVNDPEHNLERHAIRRHPYDSLSLVPPNLSLPSAPYMCTAFVCAIRDVFAAPH
eukprot:6176481-Pleurochrysis_carterae.AAC.2